MSLNIPPRLRSRKFWAMVFGLLVFLLNKQYNDALYTLLAYIGVQGAVDYKQGTSTPTLVDKNPMSQNNDEPDMGKLVTGSGRIAPFDEQPPASAA